MFVFLGFDLDMTIDRVLIRAEGPQLCTGTDSSGQRWLVFRSRSDAEASLWLCSPITDRALRQVETGSATPRDALRHSSTGLVELVSYAGGRVVPERCLLCGEIPELLLPPAELRVASFVEGKQPASAHRSAGRQVASHHRSSTLAVDASSRQSGQSEGTRSVAPAAA
jgi:hypothetical protein